MFESVSQAASQSQPFPSPLFAASLVESTTILRTGSRWPAIISFSAQAVILATLIAIPLLYPDVVPLQAPRLTSLAPPPRPPQAPPPPPRPIHVEATTATSAPTAPSTPTQPAIAQPTWTSTLNPVDAPPLAVGLNLGPARPNLPTDLIGSTPAGPHVTTAPSPSPSTTTLKISSGVIAGLLINPIQPVYPAIARVSRTQGIVIIQATISRTGHIESAHVLSGNPMLQGAALQAVRDARYHPYLLNGQPTEVETTITINFTLGS